MKDTDTIIWKYLDGQADPGERQRIEARLEQEPAFRERFRRSQVLHQNLQAMEAEGPSMRFVQNVMEQLPPVKDLATGPIISRRRQTIFIGGIMGLIALLTGSTWLLEPGGGAQYAQVENLQRTLFSWMQYLPSGSLLLGGIIVISLFLLLLLDRWLQLRLSRS